MIFLPYKSWENKKGLLFFSLFSLSSLSYNNNNKMITDINNNPIRDSIVKDGYVVIDGLIPTDSFPKLVEACDRAVDRARRGDWQYRRLVGTQFPPWKEGTDVWGVQHLMHPDLGESEFAEWYGSEQLQNAVCDLLGTTRPQLQLGTNKLLFNIHILYLYLCRTL